MFKSNLLSLVVLGSYIWEVASFIGSRVPRTKKGNYDKRFLSYKVSKSLDSAWDSIWWTVYRTRNDMSKFTMNYFQNNVAN